MFSIGVLELALIVAATVLAMIFGRQPDRRWLFGIPAMFAVCALTTPANPDSQLLIAIPCSLIYAVALIRQKRNFGQAA